LPDRIPSALGLVYPLCTDLSDVRGLFNPTCPLVLPKDIGMSVLLTSPAYLLALPAIRWGFGWSRLVTGASLAVLIVAFVNLMHFSQGWVQFGYRFSLDFAPWAILLVALGLERIAARTGPAPAAGSDSHRLGAVGGASANSGASRREIARRTVAWIVAGLAVLLVLVSVLVNFWGVVWGNALGW
jgi:hypothetical protein